GGERGRGGAGWGAGAPLSGSVEARMGGKDRSRPIPEGPEPVIFVTAGTRGGTAGRPPGMSIFNEFFDKPAARPHETYLSKLELKRARVESQGRRAAISLNDLTIGPFQGELRFTLYSGTRLVHMEAVVSTQEESRAILYDMG